MSTYHFQDICPFTCERCGERGMSREGAEHHALQVGHLVERRPMLDGVHARDCPWMQRNQQYFYKP